MPYPAITTEGETVQITEKVIEDGSANIASVVLTDEEGRKYRPTPNGLRVEEIVEEAPAAAPAPDVDDDE